MFMHCIHCIAIALLLFECGLVVIIFWWQRCWGQRIGLLFGGCATVGGSVQTIACYVDTKSVSRGAPHIPTFPRSDSYSSDLSDPSQILICCCRCCPVLQQTFHKQTSSNCNSFRNSIVTIDNGECFNCCSSWLPTSLPPDCHHLLAI